MELISNCRLCLQNHSSMEKLFSGTSTEINKLFSIELENDSRLSSLVCAECVAVMGEVKDFREKVESSQKLLKQFLGSLEPKVDPEGDTDTACIKDEVPDDYDEALMDTFDDFAEVYGDEGTEEEDDMKEEEHSEEEVEDDQEDSEDEAEPPTPRKKRQCLKLRKSLAESTAPGTKVKQKDDDDEQEEWKPSWSKPSYVPKPRNSKYRPKEVIEAEKKEKERKRKQRLLQAKKDKRKRAPLDNLMKDLGILKCHKCSASFDDFSLLHRHNVEEHNNCRAFVYCCGQRQYKDRIDDHMRYHQDDSLFKCQEGGTCGQVCTSAWDLTRHKKEQHGIKEARGPTKKRNLPISCPICPKRFYLQPQLTTHLKLLHSPTTGFQCDQCAKGFLSKDHFVAHKRSHETPDSSHICHICGKGFGTNTGLLGHVKYHTKPKPEMSQCDICERSFVNVEQHKLRVHETEEAYFQCHECGKTIKKSYRQRHIYRHYMSGSQERIPCPICGKEFKDKVSLKNHYDIHMGVRFACFFCPETYGATSNRNKHLMKKHAEEYAQYKNDKEEQRKAQYPQATATRKDVDEEAEAAA